MLVRKLEECEARWKDTQVRLGEKELKNREARFSD